MTVTTKPEDVIAEELSEALVYRSKDGKLVALLNARKALSFHALKHGAELVVFHSTTRQESGELWHAVGLMHDKGQRGWNCGEIVCETLARHPAHLPLWAELCSWFLDPRGFFAGRTDKSSNHGEPLADIVTIAKAIDAAWVR